MNFIIEITKYFLVRRKGWLLPIFIVLGLLGFLFVFGQGSAVAPFIYTLF
ncbi:DUF5989 family protein [Alphaproteobacteria bacterium]|nr:DUF5989 family protein [Alphaproteobacteria bacterium]